MTESLFTSQVPSQNDQNDGTPSITRGMTIQFATSGKVSGIRWWCPVTTSGTYTVALWELSSNTAGSLLASKVHSGTPASNGWNVTPLDSDVSVVSTKAYRIGVNNSEGRYVASSNVFTVPLVNGNLTAEADNATVNGIAVHQATFNISGALALPTTNVAPTNYFVDLVFTADVGGGGEDHPTTGTAAVGIAATATETTTRVTAGAGRVGIAATATHSGGDGGGVQDGAKYEIEQIMEAIAALFDGIETGDEVGGVAITLECHAEVVAEVQPPSVVLELDDLTWDLNMGHGADGFTIAALALVTYQDMDNAQRALWRFLSRKNVNGVTRLKKVLEDDQTLGGLVSYAILTTVRNIGIITYAGVDYLGAEMIIEVIS